MPAKDLDRLREDIVFEETLKGRAFTFHATWGLFNPKRVDPGSRLLIDYIQTGSADRCLDLGCGYGPIGLALGHMCPEGEVQMVDKDFVAIDYAAQNAARNGLDNCRAYLSNGFSHVPEGARFDTIVSNLPAKVGNELLTLIMHDACGRLEPGGRLWVVTISGLKNYIKRNFKEVFGNYKKIKQRGTHQVSLAVKE
jgi:16S rRNA G1207 methylase RsmC